MKYYKFDAFKLQENVLRFFYHFAMVVLCELRWTNYSNLRKELWNCTNHSKTEQNPSTVNQMRLASIFIH